MFFKFGGQYTNLVELIRKSEDTVYVHQDNFESSCGRFVWSEGFSRCSGLAFFDGKKSALAHISGATSPQLLIKGYVGHVLGGEFRPVEKLQDVFDSPKDVQLINIYHDFCHSWLPEEIEHAMNSIGINKINHVALETIPFDGSIFHRAIAIDSKNKEVYIFPNNKTSLIRIPF